MQVMQVARNDYRLQTKGIRTEADMKDGEKGRAGIDPLLTSFDTNGV